MAAGSLVDDLALKLARSVLGRSQRQVAETFGVTENTYRRWELDGMRPDPGRREQLRSFVQQAIDRTEGRAPSYAASLPAPDPAPVG